MIAGGALEEFLIEAYIPNLLSVVLGRGGIHGH
jgi:hypothetical protein